MSMGPVYCPPMAGEKGELGVGFEHAQSIVPALNKPLPEESTSSLFSVETNTHTRLRGHANGGFGMNSCRLSQHSADSCLRCMLS